MKEVFERIMDDLSDLHEMYINQCGVVGSNIGASAVSRCKEIIENAVEEYKGGWIPCSERLPEESHDYLICDDKGNVYSSTYHNNRWLVNFATDEVIAWQPLPEKYKGE